MASTKKNFVPTGKETEDKLRAALDEKQGTITDMKAKFAAEGLPNFDEWSEDQVGFAPYWKPEEGEFFYGALVAKDTRDPNFIRYLVKAFSPHTCQRGPADGAEMVKIEPGDFFSISVWAQLEAKFDEYLSYPFEVPLRALAVKKTETSTQGRKVWNWSLRVPPDIKLLIEAARKEEYKALLADRQERAALQS